MGLGFCLFAALAILALPLDWLFFCAIAALWHEFCHLLAIYCCSGKWMAITAGFGNAAIRLPLMSRGKELLCALAGPAGGLCLLLLSPWFPKLGICAFVQSVYNLLPVYPLDGGRALWCVADLLLPPAYAEYVCEFIAALCLGVLLAAGLFAFFILDLGPLPALASCMILIKSRKFPCNAPCLAVQ